MDHRAHLESQGLHRKGETQANLEKMVLLVKLDPEVQGVSEVKTVLTGLQEEMVHSKFHLLCDPMLEVNVLIATVMACPIGVAIVACDRIQSVLSNDSYDNVNCGKFLSKLSSIDLCLTTRSMCQCKQLQTRM